jgi:hypothetical protein
LTLVYIVPVLAAIAFGLYMLLGILLAVGSALTP